MSALASKAGQVTDVVSLATFLAHEKMVLLDQVDTVTQIFEPVLNPKDWKKIFQTTCFGQNVVQEW
jgi:hypothetical protein